MNLQSIVLLVFLSIVVGGITYYLYRKRKNGGCSSCPSCPSCVDKDSCASKKTITLIKKEKKH